MPVQCKMFQGFSSVFGSFTSRWNHRYNTDRMDTHFTSVSFRANFSHVMCFRWNIFCLRCARTSPNKCPTLIEGRVKEKWPCYSLQAAPFELVLSSYGPILLARFCHKQCTFVADILGNKFKAKDRIKCLDNKNPLSTDKHICSMPLTFNLFCR